MRSIEDERSNVYILLIRSINIVSYSSECVAQGNYQLVTLEPSKNQLPTDFASHTISQLKSNSRDNFGKYIDNEILLHKIKHLL